jgi:2',3'-cyclic-nucleotide 2'-phosphodiesterase (5'-nucleotidase family)/predicted AlkP superfamily phosphohydrolase/phosphomutase
MKRWARWLAPAFVGAAAFVLTMTAGTAVAKQDGRPVDRVVMFASDGMRPDLMERYAKAGFMPTYKNLMKDGATGANGMVQAFPPNTGVGWYTMATGTYPSEHGSTNNTFFRAGDAFSNRTSFSAAGVLQADTIANAAERAGKKVAQIDWVGGVPANIAGPTVDFTNFFSNRGVLVGAADPVEQSGSAFFGVTYQVSAAPVAATGWTSVPAGDPAAPAKETTWAIPTTFAAQNPARTYNVYFYDSVTGGGANYDHAIVSPVGKTGASPSIDLKVGDFLPIKLTGANGLINARVGQTVGHYVKLISLAPDLSNFKLYDTSLARAIARCGAPCNGLPAGGAGEDRLEKYIADNLLPWAAADFAPLEGGVVDEDTYVQQGRDLERAYSLQVINFILGTLQPDTDLAMVGYPFTDEVSHQFMGLVSPTEPDGSPNPCYDVNPKFDDVQCTGRGTAGRVDIREGYIRSAYEDADEKLGITRELMGGNPTTFAGSDHGFAPQAYAVNANQVLNSATVGGVSLHASGGSASNCSAVGGAPVAPPTAPNPADDITKACWAGGTIQIYVNPNRLKNAAQPTSANFPTYEEVRTAVRNAFQSLTDPAHPGDQVVTAILNKEDLRNVDGSDSLHPNRSGDVVVVLRPPYQSDAGTAGQKIALSHFFGQHGYLPNYVDLKNNINMHAVFVLGGPGVKHKQGVAGLRAIDVAPTVSFLMDIPGPQNARGRILYDLVKGAEGTREITILDISDWHAQLTPLAEASDTLGPSFGIAGSAFLKRWFDIYEAESALSGGSAIEVAGGDSFGGATPPISNFFEDKPTPPIMGMMGIDVDVLGNHSFDRGQTFLRTELIPLAPFPMLSANVVFPDGTTPPEWSKSTVLDLGHDVTLGVVGFTTESTPDVVFPGNLDPFEVRPVVPAVNAEAAALAEGTDAILALGHEGASSGTVDNPSGPLIDIADSVTNVDAVIGDHNDVQVDSLRANGVLVTENRGKGIRFTRMRLVIGPEDVGVVYKTADFHKPWNIGLTPDPAIQAKIDELNAQLAPILGTQIGSSTKFIPRADQCGRADGRLCESFVGNVVTDAMRTRYSSIGVQFAITNSGGLRADLTCPTTDLAGDFCPAYAPPPFPITRGQSLAVLPFGNIVVTLDVNGAELKTMLENGVSLSVDPATLGNSAQGRFPQVSGLCFTYNIAAPSGSRVTSAVVANPLDGSCTATPVDLTAGTTYKIAENDFMATGGDGYPNFASRMTTQDIMEQVAADYITATSPLTPVVRGFPDGRINCADSNGATLPNCPTLVPSP